MHVYSITIGDLAVAAKMDLFEFVPSANVRVAIREIAIAQDAGVDDLIGIDIFRGYTTPGSGGSAATPVPFNPYIRAAETAATVLNTTQASSGTPVRLYADAWNTRAGWYWRAKDYPVQQHASEFGLVFKPSERGVIRITKAPSAALNLHATLVIEELPKAPV